MANPSILENKEQFIQTFGSIFEHSAWIAETAWESRPFANTTEVLKAMLTVLNNASKEQKLTLIRAHPELAGKKAIAGDLTQDSMNEQTGAGLNACSEKELATITDYNQGYLEKFGFPFIIAVKGLNKHQIIEQFGKRLEHDIEDEFNESLRQIIMIGEFRMKNIELR